MINYIIIVVCVATIAVGQLLFKTVGARMGDRGFEALLVDHRALWLFLVALTLYGLATLGWVLALRHVPLSTAYMFMSVTFLLVPVLAWAILGEPISMRLVLGGALILAGIFVAAAKTAV